MRRADPPRRPDGPVPQLVLGTARPDLVVEIDKALVALHRRTMISVDEVRDVLLELRVRAARDEVP